MEVNTHVTRDELARRFSHHPPPTPEVGEAHAEVRSILLEAADRLVIVTGPPTREQSLMITKLEEAMMWANAGIARSHARVSLGRTP